MPSDPLLVDGNGMPMHYALGLLLSEEFMCVICVFCCCVFFLNLYVRSLFWVSVLSSFFHLCQSCIVYVKGNRTHYFSLYTPRIIKYVALFPCNLIKCCKKEAKSFLIIIRKTYFVVFFCNPVLILPRNERYYV